jgi:hypothetical protein
MKYLLISGLLLVSASCSTPDSEANQAQPSVAARATMQRLIRQHMDKPFTYVADLGWRETKPSVPQEAGEIRVQLLLASWVANTLRSTQVYDTIFNLQSAKVAQHLYGPNWRQVASQAAIEADKAQHRAKEQSELISHLVDSLSTSQRHAGPLAATGTPAGRYWRHYFQFKYKADIKKDSIDFIVLPSQQVVVRYPLAERFWVPKVENDPF